MQADVQQLIMTDASIYPGCPPVLRGSLPQLRLARRLCIEAVSLVAVRDLAQLLVSAELRGAYAEGYRGEKTSFIRR